MFGTGEGSLGYELLSGTCSVQERGLWGTYSPEHVEHVWYRSCLVQEGPLGYELPWTCLVPSGTLWSCWYRRGAWGTNYPPEHVWYRRGPGANTPEQGGASDVRNAPQNTLGIGKWAIVYRINEKRIPVQGLNFIRLTITILTEIFDNYEELQ